MAVNKKNKPVVFSALEVANICGVVNQTAINWINNGHMKAFRTPGGQYRVYPEDLVKFMIKRSMQVPKELKDLCKANMENQSVLIVDDDKSLNNVIKVYLEEKFSGMLVYQAFDGFDAGSKMVDKKPKFILLDLDLPQVDGFDLLRRIRENDCFGKPYIFVMTALQGADIQQRCFDLGATVYFNKPIDLVSLAAKLESMFSEEVQK